MSKRSKAYYRHHRKRIIQKKLAIYKSIYDCNSTDPVFLQPGRLNKKYIGCSCKMCKYEKHFNIPRPKVASITDSMKNDITDYFKEH